MRPTVDSGPPPAKGRLPGSRPATGGERLRRYTPGGKGAAVLPKRVVPALVLAGAGILGCWPGPAPDPRVEELAAATRHLDAGRPGEALRTLAGLADRTGTAGFDAWLRARTQALLARAHLEAGDPAKAREPLRTAVSLDPSDPSLRIAEARLAIRLGGNEQAVLARLAQLPPSFPVGGLPSRLSARLARRHGKAGSAVPGVPDRVPGLPPDDPQGRLAASEAEDDPVRALEVLTTPPWPEPVPAEVREEILELEFDLGEVRPDSEARIEGLPGPVTRERLRARRERIAAGRSGPGEGALFRAIRRDPAASMGERLRLLAILAPPGGAVPDPVDPAPAEDRDPASRRKIWNGVPRVVVVVAEGLPRDRLAALPVASMLAGRGRPVAWSGGPAPAVPEPALLPFPWLRSEPAGSRVGEGAEPRPLEAPGIPESLSDLPERRERLLGATPILAHPLVEGLVALDRDLAIASHRAAVAREASSPRFAWIELPSMAEAVALLPAGSSAGGDPLVRWAGTGLEALAPVRARLAERVDQLLGRLLPTLDRDDHVLLVAPAGPGLAGWGFLSGPRARRRSDPGAAPALTLDATSLAGLAIALAEAAPDPGTRTGVPSRPAGPFAGR